MIGNERPSRIWGIWVRNNRTFYWLETGPQRITFAGDKLRGILISRSILKYKTNGIVNRGEEPYLDMTLEQAQEKGYVVERVFVNDHVKASIEAAETKKEKTTKSNPWG
jgi:hypothetical protein